ncbi:MAG: glycosyltransferase [Candidatus Promineifilaceae bacterium]|nr:glycosyltransferase [Candidatus Promineifilaceae bacterium]
MAENTTDQHHEAFLRSNRPHILMITNHGIHQWDVIPGLPDTGGQNVFVNQFTDTLAQQGFKITIANRGGYPHPVTDDMRSGLDYKNGHERILYLEDDVSSFVRKEDMNEHTAQLTAFLDDALTREGQSIDLIISHYWDAAKIGVLYNDKQTHPIQHVWVPHSLGKVKKRNMPPETYEDLRIDERIQVEQQIVPQLDAVAATSSLIRQSLKEDYGLEETLFLPPCVRTERFRPRDIPADHDIWSFVAAHLPLSEQEVQQHDIVTEISRTDQTKRKDVLIKAFAQVLKQNPRALLLLSIDDSEEKLAADLRGLIDNLDIASHVAEVGYVWDQLPDLYAITSVYCSPSVMEGFGMSVQQAAATKVPVIGSPLIPFVKEYLLGEEVAKLSLTEETHLQVGDGAIIAPADNVEGFARALEILLQDPALRHKMGGRAYELTIPHFTWTRMTERFLDALGVESERD